MKPKVAIVRGPGLSKWEMQIYEPLAKSFNLMGLGSKKPTNDCAGILFPVEKLFCPGQYLTQIPYLTKLIFNSIGDTQWLTGFNKSISGFDIIHSVELRNAYSLQAVRAKKLGLIKKVTLTVYENIPFISDEISARKKIKGEVIGGVDYFFAANKAAKEALLLEGAVESKITIIPQSVDTNIFYPTQLKDRNKADLNRKKYGFKKEDFIVLGIGRMVWEKGWWDLLRSLKKLKIKKIDSIKVLLAGGGPEENNLKQFAKENNINDSVKLLGSVSYKDMPETYKTADVFVLPSIPIKIWNEQFGGVLIEAMATGLPIIGTLNGGIKETVGDAGGIFIQSQSFYHLADAIEFLYKNPKEREKMGKRNREAAVNKYDNKKVADQIGAIWKSLLIKK